MLLSFPSALVTPHMMHGIDVYKIQKTKDVGDASQNLKTLNMVMNNVVINEMINNINISKNNNYYDHTAIVPDSVKPSLDDAGDSSPANDQKKDKPFFEDPLAIPIGILKGMNKYRFTYKQPVVQFVGEGKDVSEAGSNNSNPEANKPNNASNNDKDKNLIITQNKTVPSLFNPLYTIQLIGLTENVPLMNNILSKSTVDDYDLMGDKTTSTGYLGDCSIKELVRLSHLKNSILGNAKYRYADFMFCRDVGKIPNNRLITLRKFSTPIGDNIFRYSSLLKKNDFNNGYNFMTPSDIGRMVTWLDDEDNKIESIMHYNYHATFKPLDAELNYIKSEDDDPERGILGMIGNSMSSNYNKMGNAGFTGNHNIVSSALSRFRFNVLNNNINLGSGGQYENHAIITQQYDNHKIYTPKNTIQSTHIYEGKLLFEQSFSLTFNYKLRGYDNINPKSAMLDLLGNILATTYTQGKFWGGENRIVGPQGNKAPYHIANSLIDQSFGAVGGFFSQFANGTLDISNVLASVGSAISSFGNEVMSWVKSMVDKGAKGALQELVSKGIALDKKLGISNQVKGQLKNALGRPALYAMNSLLPGGNTGLWHVTIGNPKNPIAAIGNLILDDAEITHHGALGIDDFPSELKVVVKLKHAKPRDMVDIARMYTKGASGFYNQPVNHPVSSFYMYDENTKFNDIEYNDWVKQAQPVRLPANTTASTPQTDAAAQAESVDGTTTAQPGSDQNPPTEPPIEYGASKDQAAAQQNLADMQRKMLADEDGIILDPYTKYNSALILDSSARIQEYNPQLNPMSARESLYSIS